MNIPSEYLNQIVTGDARVLAERIPDQSIDLIFTDPVYENIADYEWLAQQAARVLKPDCACLVWCSSVKQYDVQPIMRQYLDFVLQLTYTKVAKTYKVWGYRTFLWTTPLLWFQRGGDHFHKSHEWLIDTVIEHSNAIVSTDVPPQNTYKWHKNPEAYVYWLLRFVKPGMVIWDPFAGSGSLECVCKAHRINFVASEILPDIAVSARLRLEQTQIPHAAFEAEQAVLL